MIKGKQKTFNIGLEIGIYRLDIEYNCRVYNLVVVRT